MRKHYGSHIYTKLFRISVNRIEQRSVLVLSRSSSCEIRSLTTSGYSLEI